MTRPLRRWLAAIDARWHTHVCPLVAAAEPADPTLQSCPACDGRGAVRAEDEGFVSWIQHETIKKSGRR